MKYYLFRNDGKDKVKIWLTVKDIQSLEWSKKEFNLIETTWYKYYLSKWFGIWL